MHPYVIADVFTATPLEGNQLGVFPEAAAFSERLMQRTARELNLSETVFVTARDGAEAEVRIFTPTTELPFAGHPVLGAAFVLGESVEQPVIALRTRSGVVPVALTRDNGAVTFGEMTQPAPTVAPFPRAEELLEALGVERAELPVEIYDNGPRHVYVALADERVVASLSPDLRKLAQMGEFGVSCFAINAATVKTRMFAPALGVPEDPATGSAAGPLAVHLVRHGRIEPGRRIEVRQGEEVARPSLLYARAGGSRERVEQVFVGGSAVIVARGHYRLS